MRYTDAEWKRMRNEMLKKIEEERERKMAKKIENPLRSKNSSKNEKSKNDNASKAFDRAMRGL
jgi:hypothetical protein